MSRPQAFDSVIRGREVEGKGSDKGHSREKCLGRGRVGLDERDKMLKEDSCVVEGRLVIERISEKGEWRPLEGGNDLKGYGRPEAER